MNLSELSGMFATSGGCHFNAHSAAHGGVRVRAASSLSNNNNNFVKQMARVLVYVRPIDAIYMDIKLNNKMDPSDHAIRIKEEPIDPEICDDLSPVDTNTGNENGTATFKGSFSFDVRVCESSYFVNCFVSVSV
ncbi:uncharacterized protein [Bombus flavifrons]|uniref:uncharacterized protein n=1 Tax=Bombus flavifrons TaxID=103934 RepID=UPI003704B315